VAPPALVAPVPRGEPAGDVRREASTDPGREAATEARREAMTDDPSGRRFTIQVGAYRARETADAVRARLAGSGQEVYITESEGPEGVRYRVRVGSFVSHDAARTAAAKLAAERQVPTYVTTR
jgi:cell division protein FtsN